MADPAPTGPPPTGGRFDPDQLFGRMALLAGHLTPAALRKALGQWASGGHGTFGHFLVERGWIPREAFPALQEEVERHTRVARYLRARRRDIALARLVLERGFGSVGPINDAIREQAALEAGGRGLFLGQILVKRGILTAQQFLEINLEVSRLDLFCESCDRRFRRDLLEDSGSEANPLCPECGEPLLYPGAPEPVLLDSDAAGGSTSAGTNATERNAREYGARVDDTGVYQLVDLGIPREIGPYRILEEMARGGMGIIYSGIEEKTGRHVAVKVLRDAENAKDVELKRFHQEIQVASRLRHPNLVTVLHSGVHDGTPYYTMEYIRGRTLRQLLRDGGLELDRAVRILIDVAHGIAYAHSMQVVHRDLKPSNVLVEESGRALVTDFGLAKFRSLAGGTITRSGDTIGTPHYMAPEQVAARPGEVDHRSDVYGLGAILYHVLTGEPPFTGRRTYEILEKVKFEEPVPPRKRRPEAPEALERVCLVSIQKDPARRYDSAEELAEDLERFLAGEPVRARSGGWGKITKFFRGRRGHTSP